MVPNPISILSFDEVACGGFHENQTNFHIRYKMQVTLSVYWC